MSFIALINNISENQKVAQALETSSKEISYHNDAESLLANLQQQNVELVILDDQSLPHQDILALIHRIRQKVSTPILLLCEPTAHKIAMDALKSGADLYLYKPFSSDSLMVHIEAVLRRVDLEKKRLSFECCGEQFSSMISRLPLTDTETQLVQYLSQRNGDIVSKASLQKNVLKKELTAFDRNLDVHISNIRRKMSKVGLSKSHIKTVHGKGYTFSERVKHLSVIALCLL
ncbi:response regulator transcription factor [Psychromonas aquatilis]|uniref:Response regulator transcription factor n=1 Tax=Psychromonas aquatilis TaxID=2005072 RepID=A0ABU9GS19_9GAMM